MYMSCARTHTHKHTNAHTIWLFNDTEHKNSHSNQGGRRGKEAASEEEEWESEFDQEEEQSLAEDSDDDEQSTAAAAAHGQTRYWTDAEHQKFLTGIQKFGTSNDLKIAQFVGTRNRRQVATHKQKHFKKNGTP